MSMRSCQSPGPTVQEDLPPSESIAIIGREPCQKNGVSQKLVRKLMATTASLMSINTILLIVQTQDIEYWDANPRAAADQSQWVSDISWALTTGRPLGLQNLGSLQIINPQLKKKKNHIDGHTIPLQRRWIFLKTPLKAFTVYVDFTRREESANVLTLLATEDTTWSSSKLFLLVA